MLFGFGVVSMDSNFTLALPALYLCTTVHVCEICPHFSTRLFTIVMQKVHYLHQNPVRAGLVEKPEDYRWSSARHWLRKPLEDEPLTVDIDQISWWER
jgi:hypothetical protein